jgi:hypothetical protein
MESKGKMLHERVYPGSKAPHSTINVANMMLRTEKPTPVKGMLHERVYPATNPMPKCLGKPNLEAAVDPMAIRTTGFP